MKACIMLACLSLLVSCSNNSSKGTSTPPTQPPSHEKTKDQSLPDKILCQQANSTYELVLLLKHQQLPEGIKMIGLKNGNSVIFKVAAQIYMDANNLLSFIETPATSASKQVKLNLETKEATLSNFHTDDLSEGSRFICNY